jgi:rare lipoprotein A (peptidoglycan hydrolase)
MKKCFKIGILFFLLFSFNCYHEGNIRRSTIGNINTRESLEKDFKNDLEYETIYGNASYYGDDFHGKKTANGEIFDMYAMTAAHKTLPFGTICSVTNIKNKKQVIVRINDRGPFIEGRILDLSKGAAIALDAIQSGVIEVKIEILKIP